MNHRTDEYWGTLLLEMAHDAREDGDLETAELLTAAAMKFAMGLPMGVAGLPLVRDCGCAHEYAVNLGGHDEIVLMQSLDLLGL